MHPRRSFTPLNVPYTFLARTAQTHSHTRGVKMSSAPLCSCSGAVARQRFGDDMRRAQKTRLPRGTSGTALRNDRRSNSALAWLLDVAPFPSHRRSRLLMRRSRNAPATIRHAPAHGKRAQAGGSVRGARPETGVTPSRAFSHGWSPGFRGAAETQAGGCQPSGVGRLKVRLACVERATTMRTGSVWLMFISTWTM